MVEPDSAEPIWKKPAQRVEEWRRARCRGARRRRRRGSDHRAGARRATLPRRGGIATLAYWHASLAVRNYSPTGPQRGGYGGSGPAQLALAILLAVTDEATAEQFYQRFKWSVISPISADPRRPLRP